MWNRLDRLDDVANRKHRQTDGADPVSVETQILQFRETVKYPILQCFDFVVMCREVNQVGDAVVRQSSELIVVEMQAYQSGQPTDGRWNLRQWTVGDAQ